MLDLSIRTFSIQELANFSSILGVFLTFTLYRQIRKMRSRYLLISRGPELVRKLQKTNASIHKLLLEWPTSSTMLNEDLSRCSSNLKNLEIKISRTLAKKIKVLQKQIIRINKKKVSDRKPFVVTFYSRLNEFIEDVRNHQRDASTEGI